jgi:hypothetical protein
VTAEELFQMRFERRFHRGPELRKGFARRPAL